MEQFINPNNEVKERWASSSSQEVEASSDTKGQLSQLPALWSQYCLWDIPFTHNFYAPITDVTKSWSSPLSNISSFYKPQVSEVNLLNKVSLMFNKLVAQENWDFDSEQNRRNDSHLDENLKTNFSINEDQKVIDEKSTYIKAVFHIVKVNRETKRQVRINKHRHVISHWEHVGSPYYARGMCKKWYFSFGKRKKNATKCAHKDRFNYAKGMWKLWYLKRYHKTHDRKKNN